MKTIFCPIYLIEHHADYGVFKRAVLHGTIQSDKLLTGPVVEEIENYVKCYIMLDVLLLFQLQEHLDIKFCY
jgi:hypothetical protein